MATYDFSPIAMDTVANEPYTKMIPSKDNKEEKIKVALTLRDIIVNSLKIRTQNDNFTEEEVNFNRKLVKKLTQAEDLTAIPLKSKAISVIKARFKQPFFPHDISYQILDAIDGEPTTAELDEV